MRGNRGYQKLGRLGPTPLGYRVDLTPTNLSLWPDVLSCWIWCLCCISPIAESLMENFYPVPPQNLTIFKLAQCELILKVSSQSVRNLSSYSAHKLTNKRTNRNARRFIRLITCYCVAQETTDSSSESNFTTKQRMASVSSLAHQPLHNRLFWCYRKWNHKVGII